MENIKKNPWNWFISFHEFFGLDFFKFSGPLWLLALKTSKLIWTALYCQKRDDTFSWRQLEHSMMRHKCWWMIIKLIFSSWGVFFSCLKRSKWPAHPGFYFSFESKILPTVFPPHQKICHNFLGTWCPSQIFVKSRWIQISIAPLCKENLKIKIRKIKSLFMNSVTVSCRSRGAPRQATDHAA